MRVFFTNENNICFIKTPLKIQNKNPVFPFVYEFISINLNKRNKNNIFECLLKVNKTDAVQKHKKNYPRILSFYEMLENEADVS